MPTSVGVTRQLARSSIAAHPTEAQRLASFRHGFTIAKLMEGIFVACWLCPGVRDAFSWGRFRLQALRQARARLARRPLLGETAYQPRGQGLWEQLPLSIPVSLVGQRQNSDDGRLLRCKQKITAAHERTLHRTIVLAFERLRRISSNREQPLMASPQAFAPDCPKPRT